MSFLRCRLDGSIFTTIGGRQSRHFRREQKVWLPADARDDEIARTGQLSCSEGVRSRWIRTTTTFSISQRTALRPCRSLTTPVPVAIVHSEHDEFIKSEHAEYLARTIPGAQLILLPGISHFAPLQRPARVNDVMLVFLGRVLS